VLHIDRRVEDLKSDVTVGEGKRVRLGQRAQMSPDTMFRTGPTMWSYACWSQLVTDVPPRVSVRDPPRALVARLEISDRDTIRAETMTESTAEGVGLRAHCLFLPSSRRSEDEDHQDQRDTDRGTDESDSEPAHAYALPAGPVSLTWPTFGKVPRAATALSRERARRGRARRARGL
jgi:hypothetical protein